MYLLFNINNLGGHYYHLRQLKFHIFHNQSLTLFVQINTFFTSMLNKRTQSIEGADKKDPKNMKNFYVKRINSFANTSSELHHQISSINEIKRSKSAKDNPDKIQKKRENNRQSARRARLRKKIYVQMLENSVDQLEKIYEESEKVLETTEQYYKSLQMKRNRLKSMEDYGGVFALDQPKQEENSPEEIPEKDLTVISTEIINIMQPKFDIEHKIMLWPTFAHQLEVMYGKLEESSEKIKMLNAKCPKQDSPEFYLEATEKIKKEYNTFLMNQICPSKNFKDFDSKEAIQKLKQAEILLNTSLDF